MCEKSVALIPARGGSKRIPRKNLALFGAKPAIGHVIEIAQQSGVFSDVAVSTDDDEIAKAAEKFGASIVERPTGLADDQTPILPVVQHAISAYPDASHVCMLIATAVFLQPSILTRAANLLKLEPCLDYVIAVQRFASPPQRGLTMSEAGRIAMLHPELFSARSQDLDPMFHDAGLFSFGRRQAWLEGLPSFTANTRAIEVSRLDSIDIDEPEDLAFARALFAQRHQA